MSQVKLVLLATSVGRADAGVPNALAAVADTPAINFVLASAKVVPRLQPLEENVFIVADASSYDGLVAWACEETLSGGFSPRNILNTKRTGASSVAADVAFAVEAAGLKDSHLVIASLDVLYRPNFNLQRIIEHSLIRAKDTVVFYRPPPGQSLAGQMRLDLDNTSLGAANPKVLAIDASPSGAADGIRAAVLAPMAVIRQSSLPDLLQQASTSAAASGPTPAATQARQLGAFVQERLLAAGRPVYALEEDFCIDISTATGLAFANGLLHQQAAAAAAAEVAGDGGAGQALREVTRAAQSMNVLPNADRAVEELLAGCSDAKRAFLDFYSGDVAMQQQIAQSGVLAATAGNGGRTGGVNGLPERFSDPSTWRHSPRKQNPMYTTTNNMYGLKKATPIQMPDVYAGSSQHFTGTFYGGVGKVSSMVTSITKSKVHNALDEF